MTTGECFGLPNSNIEIEISAGWNGGTVEKIETEAEWFCGDFNGV